MSVMVRTQVYISRDVHEELKRRSKATGLAMAEQIRRALREYLEREEGVVLREDDPIWNIVGAGSFGANDVSIHHDKYLYGWEKDKGADLNGTTSPAILPTCRPPSPSPALR
jgi:hypothetical protein